MTPELMSAIFEQAGVGLCLVDPDHRVLLANPSWLRAVGMIADDAIGSDFFDILPEARDLAMLLAGRLEAGETVDVPRYRVSVLGRETWWQGRISPLELADGRRYLVTSRDVTAEVVWERERERLVEELREMNWQLVLSNSRQNTLSGQIVGSVCDRAGVALEPVSSTPPAAPEGTPQSYR